RNEQLRHLPGVHVPLDGSIGGRAKRLKDQQHLVAFDELARLLDRLWRTERVVIGNKSDLAAIDAALSVDLAKIGSLGRADNAVGRQRPAVRHDVADLDLRISCAGIVILLGNYAASACKKQNDGGRKRRQSSRDEGHFSFS